MDAGDLVLVRGFRDTRATLRDWNDRPWPTIGAWALGALAVALLLLCATWAVASLSRPDSTPYSFAGYTSAPRAEDVLELLKFNSLVLALHAMACVAGFIAGSSLPLEAQRYSGTWRWIHDRAGPLAIAFVGAATLFSLSTQAFILGSDASTFSHQLGVSPARLLVGLAPHAIPELMALFLPLAAWLIASRRGEWSSLLAATFVTVAIAVPVLVLASIVEVYLTPHWLSLVAGHA